MALVRGLLKLVVFAVLAMVLFVGGWISGRLGIGRVVDPASLTDAERQFADRMRNVDMVGTFTVWGREERTPRTDRYEIVSVEKIADDQWRFNTKMDCCGLNGATMPIAVPMRWVGDTPVIGAGTWADEHVAVSCTGTGEQFIQVAAAHELSARVRHAGVPLDQAAAAVVEGLDGGFIALGADGSSAMPFNTQLMYRGRAAAGSIQTWIWNQEEMHARTR